MNNYPPGVTGNEWQIVGSDEFEFECPVCREQELLFYGTKHDAWSECPDCGEVNVSPSEVWDDWAQDAREDAERDEW